MERSPTRRPQGAGTIPSYRIAHWGAVTSQLHTKYFSCVTSFNNMPFCGDTGAQKFGVAERDSIHL